MCFPMHKYLRRGKLKITIVNPCPPLRFYMPLVLGTVALIFMRKILAKKSN